MSEKIVIFLIGIRDVEKGFCLGKGSIEKISLGGVYFLSRLSRNIL